MNRVPVESSSIRSVGYDPATGVLHVEFTSGSLYAYASVPPEVCRAFLAASSKGTYFNANVRDKYLTRRLR